MDRGYTHLARKIWDNKILKERGKEFSRLEAWLYMTNILARGVDDPDAGLARGEFHASERWLAKQFRWTRKKLTIFLQELQAGPEPMILRRGQQRGQLGCHFIVCKYELYNPPGARKGARKGANIIKEGLKEGQKDLLTSVKAEEAVTPKVLLEIFRQYNRNLPEVKALTPERMEKCRARINQAVHDGCLSQYLVDFKAAVEKSQLVPFLRGEGPRGWRANFDWFIANNNNVYAVLEGKYDGACSGGGSDRGYKPDLTGSEAPRKPTKAADFVVCEGASEDPGDPESG